MGEASRDPLMEATRAEVVAYGLRRATMTSIAKRAGLSRATLYRRAESTQQLVLDALAAEFARILDEAAEAASGGSPEHARARLVAITEHGIRRLWGDGLVRALLDHDPELLLPYLVDRLGRSQEVVVALMAAEIGRAQSDGSARAGDPRTLAVVIVQALTPFVVGRRLLEGTAGQADWPTEAARLVDAYLTPTASP
ncbi:TetR/AcrR family transcriptional regulator [Sinomonas halotolerans]|uniref:TetR/AcrR family transcriptional regulator n=1 Tax=Sinomonas halotolerans TaxID=1644133 RepID=A0ABU9X6R0_9MICC